MFPTIVLKPGKEKSLLAKHPWLFSGAIAEEPSEKQPGMVVVSGKDGTAYAYGFYDPQSQIRCRIFERDTRRSINNAYWSDKLQQAILLRETLGVRDLSNAYRLIHAEGDNWPGLIIDIYDTVAVLQPLIGAIEPQLPLLTALLREQLGIRHYYLKANSSGKRQGAVNERWLGDPAPMPHHIQEHGLIYEVDNVTGQKTGMFLDQRDNRLEVSLWAKGRRVLNAFCYSGGFSLAAHAGGALSVDSIDISTPAIALCERNIAKNFPKALGKAATADCFDFLRSIKGQEEQYDLIILDPPAFAKHRGALAEAYKGYKDINLSAIKAIAPGGLIFTFSCSQHIDALTFQKIIFKAALDAGRNVRILKQLGQAPDHPVSVFHPEGTYLKGLLLHVS